jgi:hypothetical protein
VGATYGITDTPIDVRTEEIRVEATLRFHMFMVLGSHIDRYTVCVRGTR